MLCLLWPWSKFDLRPEFSRLPCFVRLGIAQGSPGTSTRNRLPPDCARYNLFSLMPTEETRLYFEDKERCLCSINRTTYSGPHKHYKNIYCRTRILYRTKTSAILQLFHFSRKVFTLEIRFSIQYRCILLAVHNYIYRVMHKVSFSVEIFFFEYKIKIIIIFRHI